MDTLPFLSIEYTGTSSPASASCLILTAFRPSATAISVSPAKQGFDDCVLKSGYSSAYKSGIAFLITFDQKNSPGSADPQALSIILLHKSFALTTFVMTGFSLSQGHRSVKSLSFFTA